MKTRQRILAILLFALPFLSCSLLQAQSDTPQDLQRSLPGPDSSESIDALLLEAQQALNREEFRVAIASLRAAIAQRPDDAQLHFQLGYALSRLDQYPAAAAEYRRALAIDPALAPAHVNLGLVLMDSDPVSAADSFRRAAALQPGQARPRYLIGQALERSGRFTEAVMDFEAAALLAPQDAPINAAFAWSLLRANRFAEAERQFRKAIALRTMPDDLDRGLALALLRQENYAAAAQALSGYLSFQPNDRQARLDLAAALQGADRIDEALAELDRADLGVPPSVESLSLRGAIFAKQKKWKESVAVFEKAVAASPNSARLYAALGHARMETRDFPGAERELLRSLELDPAAIGPLRDLAATYHAAGECPAALSALDRLGQRETPAAVHWFFRAVCYDKMRQQPEALAAYQKFIELDGGRSSDQDFQARQRISILQREIGNRR
jgi:Flp pilus assembly protein TadD